MMGKGRSWGNVRKEETAMYTEKEKGKNFEEYKPGQREEAGSCDIFTCLFLDREYKLIQSRIIQAHHFQPGHF